MSGRTSREPTVRQRQQARQEGFVSISREFIFAVGFSLLAVCFWLRGPGLFDHLEDFVKSQFAAATLPGELNGVEEIRRSAVLLVRELSPFLLTIVATVYLGHWVQQGPLWTPDRLAPDVSRLDPARGLLRMFRLATVFSTLIGVAKFIFLPVTVGWAIFRNAEAIVSLLEIPVNQMLPVASLLSLRIAAACALGMLGIAVLDMAGRWWLNERDLRRRISERDEGVKAVQNDVAELARRRTRGARTPH